MRKYSEEVAEKAYQQGEEAGKEIGKEIGQRQANIAAIKNMIIRFQATKEVILEDYTESEYNTAIAELQAKAK
jgi:flagellar biosynthesis/type III secretory pathway protein FliH